MNSSTYLLLRKVTCSHRVNMMKGKETISLLWALVPHTANMSVFKGVLFSFLMLYSSTFGAIFLLIPLIPLIFFQPKVGRQMMDQMIWIWQIYAVVRIFSLLSLTMLNKTNLHCYKVLLKLYILLFLEFFDQVKWANEIS